MLQKYAYCYSGIFCRKTILFIGDFIYVPILLYLLHHLYEVFERVERKFLSAVYGLVMIGGSFVLNSCNKTVVDTNTTTVTDNSLCEEEFFRMTPMITSICATYKGDGVKRVMSAHYPMVTVSDTVANPGWPRTMTIDYGTGVVDTLDGRNRSGVVTTSFSGYWHNLGTTATITYANYFVNSISYSGSVTITHATTSGYEQTVENGVCKQGSATIFYSGTTLFNQVYGVGDSLAVDGVFNITGSGSGTDRDKTTYTVNITKTLLKRNNCSYISQGIEVISPSGLATRTVDYGAGVCDNQVSVSINGNSFNISIQ